MRRLLPTMSPQPPHNTHHPVMRPGRVAFESHTVSKEVVYYDDSKLLLDGSFESKPADARRVRATQLGAPGWRGRRLRNPLLGR